MGQRCGEEKRGVEEEKRTGVQTVTEQEMTNVTCAQLSLSTDQNTGWKHLSSLLRISSQGFVRILTYSPI